MLSACNFTHTLSQRAWIPGENYTRESTAKWTHSHFFYSFGNLSRYISVISFTLLHNKLPGI